MRKLIIVGVGILVLGGAFLLSKYLKESKKTPVKKIEKTLKTVFVDEVKNGTVPIIISANGNLTAKKKVELFSEVQGVLKPTGKDFKAGVTYQKGQTLLKINSDEFYASIQSQRSGLQSLIASIMPDLRLDFPDAFQKWDSYLKNLDINKSLAPLPVVSSDKEKYFITGRNIYTTYYTIKNLETRLGKYNIRAPFTGILTETLVSNGTLVRAGQKMGEFISTGVFELELSVSAQFANILKIGNKVPLQNLEKTNSWTGTVSRINGRIDQNSQTVSVFIEVNGENLKEGMYLEANVPAKEETNAIEINRKLLVENKAVYTVLNDTILNLTEINPVYFNENTIVVKGLQDGTKLVSKPIPGAYAGMPVTMFSENKKAEKQ